MKQGINKLLCNIKSLPAEIVGENKSFLITGRLPRLRLAMTALRGFTLIELLVVVLIIGILAAVALPQYEAAVMKSRLAKYMGLVASMTKAQEEYFLANGEYATDLDDLVLSFPVGPECERFKSSISDYYKCGEDVYGIWDGFSNVQAGTANGIRYVKVFKENYQHYAVGKTYCFTGPKGAKACQSLGGVVAEISCGWSYCIELPS